MHENYSKIKSITFISKKILSEYCRNLFDNDGVTLNSYKMFITR